MLRGGERIATGALRPRNDGSRKNLRVIPRPVRRLVVGIRNTPVQIQRGTACHSQCAHWLRNDRVFSRSAVGMFSLSLLHFSRFCGILGVFNLTLKEFSPWKP